MMHCTIAAREKANAEALAFVYGWGKACLG
jgi:hypothetical protein